MRTRQSRPNADEPFDGGRRVAGLVVDPAGVRHLAAGLEIERRPGDHDIPGLARREAGGRLALLVEQNQHRHAGHARGRVALELVAGNLQLIGQHPAADGEFVAFLAAAEHAVPRAPCRAGPPSRARTPRGRPSRPASSAVSSMKSNGTPNVS